jgi:hypothetical protein
MNLKLLISTDVINARKKTQSELGQIGNMDEVPPAFDVPPNTTVDNKGSTTITIKHPAMKRPITLWFYLVAQMAQNFLRWSY